MSQCVPSWDVDDNQTGPRVSLRSNSNSAAPDVPMLDSQVAELTWQNGQISMNGFGLPRFPEKPIIAAATNTRPVPSMYTCEKLPRASGTLESIVNQANCLPHRNKSISDGVDSGDGDDLVPWFEPHRAAAVAASNTMTMDALVPCSNRTEEQSTQVVDCMAGGIGTCKVGCSTRVGSCDGAAAQDGEALLALKRTEVARVPVAHDWSSRDHSGESGRGSHHVTLDTCDRELDDGGYISTSMGSPENTSSAKQFAETTATAANDHDSVCYSISQGEASDKKNKKRRTMKSSMSTKGSRTAAVHNQSERKRRDKINQRMKTLQKLVPNSSKTDKASILDEVIEYMKQLQAQVQMMSRMSMPSMVLPMTMQQQLQMSMMAPMGMGLGMGMGMGLGMGVDMNTMARPNVPTIPPFLHPITAFMPMASWDASGSGNRLQGPPATVMPDPLSTFLACQSQPMTMDAYSRIAAMYQQLQQAPPFSKS